jgi:AbrB family looped-hinge helix DNA binding protein
MLMEEHLGTVTQKGQVTIPLAIRKLLGVKSQDRVAFRVIEGRVELAPATMSLEDTYGAVKPTGRPEKWSGIRSQVREERTGLRTSKTIRPRKEGR